MFLNECSIVGGSSRPERRRTVYCFINKYKRTRTCIYIFSLRYNKCGYNNNIFNHHQYVKHDKNRSYKSNTNVYVQYN